MDGKLSSFILSTVFALSGLPACGQNNTQFKAIQIEINLGHYSNAVRMLQPLANNNLPHAEWMLGDLYLKGKGVVRDFKKSQELWERATAAGDKDAMCSLGFMLSHGLCCPEDPKRVIELLKKSAELGCVRLSWCYREGIDFKKDLHLSQAFAERARKHGCASGEYEIGRSYFQGLGVGKDYTKAFYWLNRAAAKGNPHAMNDLSVMYADGNGVKADLKMAIQLDVKAAQNDCPFAKRNMAQRYEFGNGVPKDIAKAKKFYEEAASMGLEKSSTQNDPNSVR